MALALLKVHHPSYNLDNALTTQVNAEHSRIEPKEYFPKVLRNAASVAKYYDLREHIIVDHACGDRSSEHQAKSL